MRRWRSDEIAPSVVPKLSLANGLVYTYTKPPLGNGEDAWYLTAIDFDTGHTLYKRLTGYGLGYNNNYAPVTLGPDGTAYVGVLGGSSGSRTRAEEVHDVRRMLLPDPNDGAQEQVMQSR